MGPNVIIMFNSIFKYIYGIIICRIRTEINRIDKIYVPILTIASILNLAVILNSLNLYNLNFHEKFDGATTNGLNFYNEQT